MGELTHLRLASVSAAIDAEREAARADMLTWGEIADRARKARDACQLLLQACEERSLG